MDIGGFFREESKAHSKRVLQTEKNPAILAQALRNLGRYAGNDTRKMLNNFLKSSSYRNELADAAIQYPNLILSQSHGDTEESTSRKQGPVNPNEFFRFTFVMVFFHLFISVPLCLREKS